MPPHLCVADARQGRDSDDGILQHCRPRLSRADPPRLLVGVDPMPPFPPPTSAMQDDSQKTSFTLLLRINGEGRSREIAWEEFDRVYRPRIMAFARRVGAAPGEADDVVQDVFAGFAQASRNGFCYDPKQSFRGYLFRATRNALLRLRERESRQPPVTAGGDAADLLPDAAAAELAWNDVWELEQVRLAVDRVREEYETSANADLRTFDAFYRATLDDRDTAEVAAELGMEEASVRKAKSRVTDKLREELATVRAEEMG